MTRLKKKALTAALPVSAAMKKELVKYGRRIKRDGWRAGERIIAQAQKRLPDFAKWAKAIRIMMRTEELLKERTATDTSK